MDAIEPEAAVESPRDVSAWLWLGAPLASMAVVMGLPLLGHDVWNAVMQADNFRTKEFGFLEVVPLFFLAAAVGLGVWLFVKRRRFPRGVGVVMLLVAVAAFYFLGEESSWGQYYIGYKTPESMRKNNRQQEVSLHNLKGTWKTIFSSTPRNVATGVMFAGAVLPFFAGWLPRAARRIDGFWYWVLPTRAMSLTCLLASVVTVPSKIADAATWRYPPSSYFYMTLCRHVGDFKEYLIALAMLVYVASVAARRRSLRGPGALQENP